MSREFRKIKVHQLQGFFSPGRAVGACKRDIRLYLRKCLRNGFGEKRDVFMGTFDVVEGSPERLLIFRPPQVPDGIFPQDYTYSDIFT